MKKKIALTLITLIALTGLTGCTSKTMARAYGGEEEITLKANQKLINITWKEDSLWYVTREMRPDETAETYEFQCDSAWGIFEGVVIIHESK